jgi:hypothetical protein
MIVFDQSLPVPLLIMQRQCARAAVLVGNKQVARVLRWLARELDRLPELSTMNTDALISPVPVHGCRKPQECGASKRAVRAA